jgi:membrane protease YdiL (CAAX protease family)
VTNIKTNNEGQYNLTKILTIWAAVSIPMPIMAFWIAPAVATGLNLNPLLVIWLLLIGGMIWQFILSVGLLYHELDEFTWAAICDRIWLKKPCDPKTGKTSYKLFWWLIPAFGFYALIELTPVVDIIGRLILIPFPILESLPDLNLADLGDTEEFVGAWWLMVVAVVSCTFNYLLGEELLFRGVLLPKMRGVFGKWDWFANSALFALYHLHRPLQMLGFIFGGLAWNLPSRQFRSIWFAIILHSLEAIPLLVGVFMIVSGPTV